MPPLIRIVEWIQNKVQIREAPIEGSPVPGGKCFLGDAVIYAGFGRTNGGGSWHVDLREIGCFGPAIGGDRRPSVVATPATDSPTDDIPQPFLLAVRTNDTDLTIWSFDLSGKPAGDVEFAWHLIVEGTPPG